MDSYIDFVSRLIYATGAEAVITPSHRDYVASTPTPTGAAWIGRYVTGATSVLGVFEDWLGAHNLPPIYPYDGSNLTEWDSGVDANVGLGLPLPSNLQRRDVMSWNFALSDPRALETLISGAGFREVSVTRELRAIRFESRQDYWSTMEAGGGLSGATYVALSPAHRRVVRDEVASRFDGPFAVESEVLIGCGRR